LVICISVALAFITQVIAADVVPSGSVSYSNSKTNETTVNGALDELFAAVKINDKITEIEGELATLQTSAASSTMVNTIYPVGSIYISTSSTNPGTIFAGTTWTAFGTGRTLVGVNVNNTSFSTVEKTGGSSSVTLTTAQLPSHTHGIPALSGTAASAGAHTHTLTASGTVSSTFTGSSATSSSAGAHTHSVSGTAASAGAHQHYTTNTSTVAVDTFINNTTAQNSAIRHQNNGSSTTQAYGLQYALAYGGTANSGLTSSNGAHTHSVSATAGSAGAHTHTLTATGTVTSTFTGSSATTSSAGAHTHTVSTTAATSNATGSGSSVSVQNPYITVYMWKRTK